MKEIKLFKRNAKGDIVRWMICELANGDLHIIHGIYGKKPIDEFITPTKKKVSEFDSRVKAKRKEGYKSIEDLYDNSPTNDSLSDNPRRRDGFNEFDYLNLYLPKYNTTDEGFTLPMLAKTLEDNTPFEKYGSMLGQWKINGVRCLVGAEKSNDLFNHIKLTYHSREGTDWTNLLAWMDDIILSRLSENLKAMMIDLGACLDGELYIPNYSVNEINSFVKNPTLKEHFKLQYWCYDIAVEALSAKERYKLLSDNTKDTKVTILDATAHKYQEKPFIVLPTTNIENIERAMFWRDDFIKIGFEGLIVRKSDAEYAFGKRNSSMFKYKAIQDGYFEIVNIKEDKRGLPIYTLKNDLNSELFDCTINIAQDKQKAHLRIKDMLIGKKALVAYRERSGIKEVPFHAKIIKIYV